ncbi:DnaD domain protein, partial [Clostridium sporogenes]|uniref:DnaD domain-containing protein n=1 Tax=Clostridium sporogenes TaxID=1509 RepID=UPI00313EE406
MSTVVFKNNSWNYTPVSNIFIDKFMPKARGEFVKVYLLGLKYCMSGEIGVSSEIIASTLHLLQTDVMNAWNFWNDEGVIKIQPIDNMGNYNIEFLTLEDGKGSDDNINLLEELNNNSVKDMLQDIEKLLSRPLSSKEMTVYIEWIKDYNFSPEIILLLIQYCVSKGKTDWRYIEKIALGWFDAKIQTIDDAQMYIKKHEDKWVKIRKILNYLGAKDGEIMKPQEEILDKWINIYK